MTAATGLLGRGAMGVVELGHAADGTPVARKRVAPAGSAAEIALARARLRREAEVLTSLEHPAIVPVLAVEDHGDDLVIVMPAMACSLADRVRDVGPLPEPEAVAHGRRLLAALVAAHRAGIVHRDVKPANVLLDHRGEAALADFGIAYSAALTAGLTSPGTVVGTPTFMAPEQARGERAGPPADVYALGATLLFACVGEARWHVGGSPLGLVADAPAALRAPLAAMLDPDPRRRPSAAALLAGTSGTATLAPAERPAHRRGRLRRLVLPGSLAALVAVGVVTVALDRPAAPPHAAPPTASSCSPLLFQPCGQPAAPHTDGRACLPGWYDLDGAAADGCEASSDWRPGTTLGAAAVHANLVPSTAVDTFTASVSGHLLGLCGGAVAFGLTAPAGAADTLVVTDGAGHLLATATSADGAPAVATVSKPGCFGRHSEVLHLAVHAAAGASPADFTLVRRGGW